MLDMLDMFSEILSMFIVWVAPIFIFIFIVSLIRDYVEFKEEDMEKYL